MRSPIISGSSILRIFGFLREQGIAGNLYPYVGGNPVALIDPNGGFAMALPPLAGALGGLAGNLAGAAAAARIGGLCYLGILCPEAKPIPLPAEPPAPQPKPNDCEPGSVGADDEGDGNEPRPPKPDRVPPDWITKPTKKNDGTEYINPENDNDRIRVMQGNPNSPYPEQQVPYVSRAVQRSQLTHHFRRGSRPCRAAAYLS